MDAVEHIISKATQVSQNEPNGQNPAISVTAFQGMTKMATKRSDTASEITKKLVTLERRCRNLVTAAQTRVFPSRVVRMSSERKQPVSTRLEGTSSKYPLSMTVVKFMRSIFLVGPYISEVRILEALWLQPWEMQHDKWCDLYHFWQSSPSGRYLPPGFTE